MLSRADLVKDYIGSYSIGISNSGLKIADSIIDDEK